MQNVQLIHGKKDKLISYKNLENFKHCKSVIKELNIRTKMTHHSIDFNQDIFVATKKIFYKK